MVANGVCENILISDGALCSRRPPLNRKIIMILFTFISLWIGIFGRSHLTIHALVLGWFVPIFGVFILLKISKINLSFGV
jgi:hypothetical protein